MKIHRRAVTEMLASLGVIAVTPALAAGKTVEVSTREQPQGDIRARDGQYRCRRYRELDQSRHHNPLGHLRSRPGGYGRECGAAGRRGAVRFRTMEQDATFSHTFTVKGTHKYICKMHEAMGMVGTVVVA